MRFSLLIYSKNVSGKLLPKIITGKVLSKYIFGVTGSHMFGCFYILFHDVCRFETDFCAGISYYTNALV